MYNQVFKLTAFEKLHINSLCKVLSIVRVRTTMCTSKKLLKTNEICLESTLKALRGVILLEVQIAEHFKEITNKLPYAALIAYANTAGFIIGFTGIYCELCGTSL